MNQLYYKTFLSYGFIRFMNYLMNFNFVYGLCSFSIYNMEMLEKIRSIQSFVRDSNKNLKSMNILACRIIFVTGVVLLTIVVKDLRLVYAINGVFLNSFIGLIIPGVLGITRNEEIRNKDSRYNRIVDILCVAAGNLSLGLAFLPF